LIGRHPDCPSALPQITAAAVTAKLLTAPIIRIFLVLSPMLSPLAPRRGYGFLLIMADTPERTPLAFIHSTFVPTIYWDFFSYKG
jgi:hypothetical protein